MFHFMDKGALSLDSIAFKATKVGISSVQCILNDGTKSPIFESEHCSSDAILKVLQFDTCRAIRSIDVTIGDVVVNDGENDYIAGETVSKLQFYDQAGAEIVEFTCHQSGRTT